jgi:hypothetical protein
MPEEVEIDCEYSDNKITFKSSKCVVIKITEQELKKSSSCSSLSFKSIGCFQKRICSLPNMQREIEESSNISLEVGESLMIQDKKISEFALKYQKDKKGFNDVYFYVFNQMVAPLGKHIVFEEMKLECLIRTEFDKNKRPINSMLLIKNIGDEKVELKSQDGVIL